MCLLAHLHANTYKRNVDVLADIQALEGAPNESILEVILAE